MGFGQYSTYLHKRGTRDNGWPEDVNECNVRAGDRMTNAQIMAGVSSGNVVKIRRTAHNEVTRWLADGRVIVRVRESDVVEFDEEFGVLTVDMCGWHTVTTRRHVEAAITRLTGVTCGLRGSKDDRRGTRNVLCVGNRWGEPSAFFRDRVVVIFTRRHGNWRPFKMVSDVRSAEG